MKLAHVILAHASPEMLLRLVNKLQHPDAVVYIHLDSKADSKAFEQIKAINNVYFIPNPLNVGWGNYSMIKAALVSFEYILATGQAFSHFNLLSGADYPLKPISQITAFLLAHPNTTFMLSHDIAGGEWDDGRERLEKYHFGDYNFKGKYFFTGLANKILPARKIPGNLKPYGRSTWFTITPNAARYVIDYLKANPGLERYFRLTWAADEIVVQTVLKNSPLAASCDDNYLRYIDWSEHKVNPKTLTMDDLQALTQSPCFFARKFDMKNHPQVLDALDELTKA